MKNTKFKNLLLLITIVFLIPIFIYIPRGLFDEGYFLLSDLETYLNQKYSFSNAKSTWGEATSEIIISQGLFFYEIFFIFIKKIFFLSDSFIQKSKYIFMYYTFFFSFILFYKNNYLKNKLFKRDDFFIIILIILIFMTYPVQKHGNLHLINGYCSLFLEIFLITKIFQLKSISKSTFLYCLSLIMSLMFFKTHPNTTIYSILILFSFIFFQFYVHRNSYALLITILSLSISQIHNLQSFLYLINFFNTIDYLDDVVKMWEGVGESVLNIIHFNNIFRFLEFHQSSNWADIQFLSSTLTFMIPISLLLNLLYVNKQSDIVKFSYYLCLILLILISFFCIQIDIIQQIKIKTIIFHNPNYLLLPAFILYLKVLTDILKKQLSEKSKYYVYALLILLILFSNKLFFYGNHNFLISDAVKLPTNYYNLIEFLENETNDEDRLIIFPNSNFRKHKWHKMHFSDLIHASNDIRVIGAGTLKVLMPKKIEILEESILQKKAKIFKDMLEDLEVNYILLYNDLENYNSAELNESLKYFINNKILKKLFINDNFSLYKYEDLNKDIIYLKKINNSYKYLKINSGKILNKKIYLKEKYDYNWKLIIKLDNKITFKERVIIFFNNIFDIPNKKKFNFIKLDKTFLDEKYILRTNEYEGRWILNNVSLNRELNIYAFNTNQDRFTFLLIIQLLSILSLLLIIFVKAKYVKD